MEGECGAYVSSDQLDSERKVGSLPMYSFFGENALLGEESLADSSSSSTSSTSSTIPHEPHVHVLQKIHMSWFRDQIGLVHILFYHHHHYHHLPHLLLQDTQDPT